jgi:hypothetical protein
LSSGFIERLDEVLDFLQEHRSCRGLVRSGSDWQGRNLEFEVHSRGPFHLTIPESVLCHTLQVFAYRSRSESARAAWRHLPD